MIKVDISNVWGQVTLSDLLAMEKEVAAAHTTLADGTGAGNDFLGWQNLPVREATEEITRIQRAAEKIRSDSDVFVVIGIGGSYLGPRAAIELLQGPNHNIGKGKGNPQIFFAGNGLSTRHWNELTRLLEGKDFSIAIISKSGTTTEPAIATRALRWMLERKYGTEGAKSRIYAITDPDVEEPELYNSIKQAIVNDRYIEKALLEKQDQLLAEEENPLLVIRDVEMLHPFYMIGAVENNIYNQIQIPMLVLYPGETQGTARSFLGIYNQDGNYRSINF
mgnify:CR=1 FL=1